MALTFGHGPAAGRGRGPPGRRLHERGASGGVPRPGGAARSRWTPASHHLRRNPGSKCWTPCAKPAASAINVTLPENFQIDQPARQRCDRECAAARSFVNWSPTATQRFTAQLSRYGISARVHRARGTRRTDEQLMAIRFTPTVGAQPDAGAGRRQLTQADELEDERGVRRWAQSLFGVRRMMEGVMPPSAVPRPRPDHVPNVGYLSLRRIRRSAARRALVPVLQPQSRERARHEARLADSRRSLHRRGRGAAARIRAHRDRRAGVRASARQAHGRREPRRHGQGVPPARRRHLPRARDAAGARAQASCRRRSRASISPTNSRLLSERMANCEDLARPARHAVRRARRAAAHRLRDVVAVRFLAGRR